LPVAEYWVVGDQADIAERRSQTEFGQIAASMQEFRYLAEYDTEPLQSLQSALVKHQ
jgi:hypothetical protein